MIGSSTCTLPNRGPVHVLHIGKTGGTALRHALSQVPATAALSLVLHHHPTTLEQVPAGERVLFALRDPISRFISAFHSRRRQGRPRYFFPWNPFEERLFAAFPTPSLLAESLADTTAPLHPLAVEAMGQIRHFAPQAHWLGSEAALRERQDSIVHVAFQHSLSEDFAAIKRLLGLPPSLALPDDDTLAHRSPAGLDRSLSPEAEASLRAWYAEDAALIAFARRLRALRLEQLGVQPDMADQSRP